MSPYLHKNIYVLISNGCDYVTLYVKRDFAVDYS